MKINGVKFEVDTMDVDISEKIEFELKKFGEKVNSIGNTANRTDVIKGVVLAVSNFFNAVLGKDASQRIFNGKKNMKLALQCMDQFVEGLKESDNEVVAEMEVITKKYSPNRAKRRTKK